MLHYENLVDTTRYIPYNEFCKYFCMLDDSVVGVVVDICARSFLVLSNEGREKKLTCEDTDQFMRVLKVCNDTLPIELIKYDSIRS